jgi:hypothetical protein
MTCRIIAVMLGRLEMTIDDAIVKYSELIRDVLIHQEDDVDHLKFWLQRLIAEYPGPQAPNSKGFVKVNTNMLNADLKCKVLV